MDLGDHVLPGGGIGWILEQDRHALPQPVLLHLHVPVRSLLDRGKSISDRLIQLIGPREVTPCNRVGCLVEHGIGRIKHLIDLFAQLPLLWSGISKGGGPRDGGIRRRRCAA